LIRKTISYLAKKVEGPWSRGPCDP